MTPLRPHMIAALQLSGTGEQTQQAAGRDVRRLAQFYGKAPHLLSEQEPQHDCLHRKNVDGLAPASMRICYSGRRFFAPHVLKRDWHTRSLLRAPTPHRLPAVLSSAEVRRLLKAATPLHTPVYCTPVYSLGLRLHAARYRQVSARDGPRLQVHVHRGTGAKDRYVPRPPDTLALLSPSWPPPSPNRALSRHRAQSTTTPYGDFSHASCQRPGRLPHRHTASWHDQHRGGHPYAQAFLRHPSARSRGQAPAHPALPGPPHRETPLVALHRTPKGPEDADTRLNALMHGLLP